jgi:hypothetical protein
VKHAQFATRRSRPIVSKREVIIAPNHLTGGAGVRSV